MLSKSFNKPARIPDQISARARSRIAASEFHADRNEQVGGNCLSRTKSRIRAEWVRDMGNAAAARPT